jgi:hypothetical protein
MLKLSAVNVSSAVTDMLTTVPTPMGVGLWDAVSMEVKPNMSEYLLLIKA